MAIDDLDRLRKCIPELFQDHALPPNWEEDLIFIAVDDPLQQSALTLDGEFTDDHKESKLAGSEAPLTDIQVLDFDSVGTTFVLDDVQPPFRESDFELRFPGPFPGSPSNFDDKFVPPPDALAFYLPFHYFHPIWWGIYLLMEGTQGLGQFIHTAAQGSLTTVESLLVARTFLYCHESFHHSVECFATRLEISFRRPMYRTGFDSRYNRTLGKPDCLEEALASAHALRRVKSDCLKHQSCKRKQALNALKEYICRCPPGYDRALEYISKRDFERARGQFAEDNLLECEPHLPRHSPEIWMSFPAAFSGISRITSRVNYIVHRNSSIAARTPLGRLLTYPKLISALRRLGFSLARRGPHEVWKNGNGRSVSVPRHPGDLKNGTLKAILAQAGLQMSLSEFLDLVREGA
jgi:predicted RNA binding protein YcfA (HicA-like mRNA interferase family)